MTPPATSRPPPARTARRAWPAAAAALLLALPVNRVPLPDRAHGQGLFHGPVPLRAYVAGQDFSLPPQAARCANCHGDTAPQRVAPLLSAAGMTQPAPRRGGPPSRYEAGSFCRLLRTGVDPAFVTVTRAMPRYDLSDAECAALWRYLTEAEP